MNRYFDPHFRPSSYYAVSDDIEAVLLRHVKGAARRTEIKRALRAEEPIDDWLIQDALSDQERDLLGSFDPYYMGGEYLPDMEPGSVELAYIEMSSTTHDVLSVRAIYKDGWYHFSVEDEYNNVYTLPFTKRRKPLTFWEMVNLIDKAHPDDYEYTPGLMTCFNLNYLDQVGPLTGIVESIAENGYNDYALPNLLTMNIYSEFYPELDDYYRAYEHKVYDFYIKNKIGAWRGPNRPLHQYMNDTRRFLFGLKHGQ